MEIITIRNQKIGSAKTNITVNLAAVLAELNKLFVPSIIFRGRSSKSTESNFEESLTERNNTEKNSIEQIVNKHSEIEPAFPMSKHAIKTPTYKMIFTLSEEAYKAFNDLYANRILRGRKIDKSYDPCHWQMHVKSR